jgi:predicted aspartyl protease
MQRPRKLRRATPATMITWLVVAGATGAASAACSIEQVGTTELAEEVNAFGLPVVVNGSPPIQFTVNTVAAKSMIDAKLAEHLVLPSFGRPRTFTSADGVKRRAFPDVSVGRLAFAGVAHAGFPMTVVELVNGRRTSPGSIGADLLSQYDVEFDFPAKRMNLYRVKDCTQDSPEFTRLWSQPHDAVPVKARPNNFLSVPVSINGKTLDLALATGFGATVLTFDAATRLGVDIERLKAEASKSIAYTSSGSAMVSYSQRFEKVQIGPSGYSDIELNVFDMKVGTYDGMLGLDFLRTRKVWVSYATQQLLVGRASAELHRPSNQLDGQPLPKGAMTSEAM